MKVTARLHATLRRATPDGLQNRVVVELPAGATVADLLAALAVDASPEHVMLLLDHRRITPEHTLAAGDEVQLFPPISGGR